MRVLFVTDCYPTPKLPQYCVFLEQQASALQKAGASVDIYHFTNDQTNMDADYILNGLQVYYRVVHKHGKRINTLYPFRLTKIDEEKFLEVLLKGYDCVSFHFGDLSCLRSVQVLCKKTGIPLILHFHGLNIWGDYFDNHPLLTAHLAIIKKRVYSKLSATVNVSGKVKDTFAERIKRVPAYIVYNGVNTEFFRAALPEKRINKDKVRILCVGNLIPIKGQKYLIEAAAELQDKGVNIELIFAGRGPDELMLKEFCRQKQVEAKFCGYLPYDEVSRLMAELDYFVLPSFYEALGCVYLEAMAAGMITVGVKGQGIEEIIRDGENGFLVEPKSVASISAALTRAINLTPQEASRISANARHTSLSYTWEKSAETLLDVYKNVIKETSN